LEMTVELLQGLAHPDPFDPRELETLAGQIDQGSQRRAANGKGESAASVADARDGIKKAREKLAQFLADDKTRQSLSLLSGTAVPQIDVQQLPNKDVQDAINAAVQAVGQRRTEEETADQVRNLKPQDIETATRLAEENADAFEKACEPINNVIRQ